MKPRLFAALSVAALLLALSTIVAACGTSTDTDATATAEAELLLEATATAEALAEEIAPSLTATAEAREEAEREAAIATAQAKNVEATATAVASIGLSRENPVTFGTAKAVPQGWEITVINFIPDATQMVLAEALFINEPPPAGFKFAIVRVRATNVSAGDPADLIEDAILNLVGSRNLSYQESFDCFVEGGLGYESPSEAFSGAAIEGNVCFEVGEDESGFVFITDFFGSQFYFSAE